MSAGVRSNTSASGACLAAGTTVSTALCGLNCECCAAEKCFGVLQTCCNTTGCYGVVKCVVKTMCSGIACYNPSTCKAEIDAAGGLLGAGTQAAQKVGDCVLSQCSSC